MQSKLNQAITLHPLFFDPVNKKALLIKKNGKEFVGYQEDRPGIIVTKDNEVIFSMYAPDAQSVEVSGVGVRINITFFQISEKIHIRSIVLIIKLLCFICE